MDLNRVLPVPKSLCCHWLGGKKIQKDDVDQEAKAQRAEEQEVCYQTPDLKDKSQRERERVRGGTGQTEADPPGCPVFLYTVVLYTVFLYTVFLYTVFLYTCHLLNTSWGLKESWRGVTRPSCCKTNQTSTIPSIIAYLDCNRGWYHSHSFQRFTLHFTTPHYLLLIITTVLVSLIIIYFILLLLIIINIYAATSFLFFCNYFLHIFIVYYLYLFSLVLLVLCWGTPASQELYSCVYSYNKM